MIDWGSLLNTVLRSVLKFAPLNVAAVIVVCLLVLAFFEIEPPDIWFYIISLIALLAAFFLIGWICKLGSHPRTAKKRKAQEAH